MLKWLHYIQHFIILVLDTLLLHPQNCIGLNYLFGSQSEYVMMQYALLLVLFSWDVSVIQCMMPTRNYGIQGFWV